jgi:polysaccharide pyruvyl transferase WcaK-like protein
MGRGYFQNADAVISIGGDCFSDDYSSPSDLFGELCLARRNGAKTVIWAASIGPFHNLRLKNKWARCLRQIDLITVREDRSVAYLAALGVKDNVRRVADPAFLLTPCENGVAWRHTAQTGDMIGIGMSGIVARYGSSMERYLEAFTKFGLKILSRPDTSIVLVPHVNKQDDGNDAAVCRALAERLPTEGRVAMIDSSYNSRQMKYVISNCDYFIGARTHSTIAALSSGVPTLSIGYSVKAWGINTDVFGHTDHVLPIDALNAESLLRGLNLLRGRHDAITRTLRSRMPQLRNLAESGGALLTDILQHVRN